MITLTNQQTDMLTELVNIGIGHAAASLNSMIGHHIKLYVPHVYITQRNKVSNHFSSDFKNISSVIMRFSGDFDGKSALMFPKESAEVLVACLTGEPKSSVAMDELKSGALTEVGNILINSVMGSISNMLKTTLHYSVPDYIEGSLDHLMDLGGHIGESVLVAETTFQVKDLHVKGSIVLFFHITSFEMLLEHLNKEIAA